VAKQIIYHSDNTRHISTYGRLEDQHD
jgi:hypothetical protein